MGRQVHWDWLLDGPGCRAAAAGGDCPGRLAVAGSESGQRAAEPACGSAAERRELGGGVACPGCQLVVLPSVVVPACLDTEPWRECLQQGLRAGAVDGGEAAEE